MPRSPQSRKSSGGEQMEPLAAGFMLYGTTLISLSQVESVYSRLSRFTRVRCVLSDLTACYSAYEVNSSVSHQ